MHMQLLKFCLCPVVYATVLPGLQGDVLMALLQRIAGARNKAADEAAAAAAKGGSGGVQHVLPQRLKVILMSATLDANIYR
jgi:HrpA-like RNA helicase